MNELRKRGFYGVRYVLNDAKRVTLPKLQDILRSDPVRHTGWGPFWFPTREEIRPKVVDNETYECIHDGTGTTRHIEKWRVTTNGEFTIVRAHDLDHLAPGDFINLILPVWRIAEFMLHAGRMGAIFESSSVEFTVLFTGLKGRVLSTQETQGRILSRNYQTGANDYEQSIVVSVADIDRQVAEFTDRLLRPFYAMFEFDLPTNFCEQEIGRMRTNKF